MREIFLFTFSLLHIMKEVNIILKQNQEEVLDKVKLCFLIKKYYYVYTGIYTYSMTQVCNLEGNYEEFVFSFHLCKSFRDWTQAARLAWKAPLPAEPSWQLKSSIFNILIQYTRMMFSVIISNKITLLLNRINGKIMMQI